MCAFTVPYAVRDHFATYHNRLSRWFQRSSIVDRRADSRSGHGNEPRGAFFRTVVSFDQNARQRDRVPTPYRASAWRS